LLNAKQELNSKISKAGYSRFFFVFLFQTYLFTFVKNIIKMLGSILLGFLGGLGGSEVILIVAIILLMFGGRKIPELMKGLGKGIREFKDASKGIEEKKDVQN
jgi:sec-independent protein translocase protein TatA